MLHMIARSAKAMEVVVVITSGSRIDDGAESECDSVYDVVDIDSR